MITPFLLAWVFAGAVSWLGGNVAAVRPDSDPAMVIEAADGSPIAARGSRREGMVALRDVPDHLVQAILAVEDRAFYSHWGIDLKGVARAAWQNLLAKKVVEGGSTVTQQTARLLFLSSDRTLVRKASEVLISFWLESRLSKEEILERYLNNVYFGAGATGIADAAKTFFDKSPDALTLAESALLAGLIHAPTRLNPLQNSKAARGRAGVVLDSMVEAGFIGEQEAEMTKNAPLRIADARSAQSEGAWFADWIHAEALKSIRSTAGRVRVRTTLQPRLQDLAERVVARKMPTSRSGTNPLQVAMVVMDHGGAILALVGGTSYELSPFNRATQAVRQPGSVFKLFVYLAALRHGWRPNDVIRDRPIEIEGWKPTNYGSGYHGRVTLTKAFARSINTVAVLLAQDVGLNEVIQAARDLGIDAALEPNASLALGTSGVTLTDLTGAFASVASGRIPVQPHGISWIFEEGEVTSWHTVSTLPEKALDHRAELVRLLQSVVRNGTGQRAAVKGFAAGKTGTSQNHRDAWFIGFTDDLVIGVWVGKDDNSPLAGVTGGSLPAQIWRDYVVAATGLTPGPVPDFVIPDEPAAEMVEAGTLRLAADQPQRPTRVKRTFGSGANFSLFGGPKGGGPRIFSGDRSHDAIVGSGKTPSRVFTSTGKAKIFKPVRGKGKGKAKGWGKWKG